MNARKFLVSVGAAVATSKLAKMVSDLEADDVLGLIGLERRRNSTIAGIGLVAVGAVIGAGAALMFAPATGTQTRARLGRELDRLGKAASEVAQEVADEAEPLLQRIAGQEENSRARAQHS